MPEIKKFRKKPVVIEAYQTDREIDIETLEGTMHASVGDWIITGVNGEKYPCKPDIFEKTYEPANEQIYLFVFDDDTTYEMNCGISLKDAVWEMSKYTGNASELFLKALRGFEENDVDGIVALFNRFFYYSSIKSVYIVREKIFPKKLLKGEDDAKVC